MAEPKPKKKPEPERPRNTQPRRNTEQTMKASPQTVHRPYTKAKIEGPRVRTAEGIRRQARPSNPDLATKLGHIAFVQEAFGLRLSKAEAEENRDLERRIQVQFHRNAERGIENEWDQGIEGYRPRGSRKTRHA